MKAWEKAKTLIKIFSAEKMQKKFIKYFLLIIIFSTLIFTNEKYIGLGIWGIDISGRFFLVIISILLLINAILGFKIKPISQFIFSVFQIAIAIFLIVFFIFYTSISENSLREIEEIGFDNNRIVKIFYALEGDNYIFTQHNKILFVFEKKHCLYGLPNDFRSEVKWGQRNESTLSIDKKEIELNKNYLFRSKNRCGGDLRKISSFYRF